MRIVITGATGYIGSRLTSLAIERGFDVIMASRQQMARSRTSWLLFDLASSEVIDLPAGTDVVVHLAANTTVGNALDEEGEVVAAQRLIKATQEAGAKFVFVSSQTARVDAPTTYGRIKWRIEQEVLASGGWIVRPGQVYGGESRGLYGTLVKLVQKMPLLPAFLPAPKVQPIHVDDLAEGLLRVAERGDLKSGVYCLASSVPIHFSSFLAEIANSRLRCTRVFVSVPVALVNLFVPLLGESWQSRLGLDRLRSLFDLPVMNTGADLDKLGLVLRPLVVGLHPSGDDRRRRLLREGKALLAYVLKAQPSNSLLRRYVRAVEGLHGGREFGLSGIFLSIPNLLSLLDKGSWPNSTVGGEFVWRVDAATMLAESTPMGAGRFLGSGQRQGPLTSILSITNALAGEAFWRLARVFVSPMLRFGIARSKDAS
ncbi:MAG: sugar nucleotide-binding protein [Betaproteobacteria bacterium]|nr:sugar nucleotide-binding protein [Betaproteobacteria bacterium]